MSDPSKLEVDDLVRFVSLPDEWQDPKSRVHAESIEFMKIMISRKWPSRVCEVDEYGTPWIEARIREDGILVYHGWGILECTAWRVVRKRD